MTFRHPLQYLFGNDVITSRRLNAALCYSIAHVCTLRCLRLSRKTTGYDHYIKLKSKLKTNLYSDIKSKDSEVLDSGTSQLGSQTEFDEIQMF